MGFKDYSEFIKAISWGFPDKDSYQRAMKNGFKHFDTFQDANEKGLTLSEEYQDALHAGIDDKKSYDRYIELKTKMKELKVETHDEMILINIIDKLSQGKKISLSKLWSQFESEKEHFLVDQILDLITQNGMRKVFQMSKISKNFY